MILNASDEQPDPCKTARLSSRSVISLPMNVGTVDLLRPCRIVYSQMRVLGFFARSSFDSFLTRSMEPSSASVPRSSRWQLRTEYRGRGSYLLRTRRVQLVFPLIVDVVRWQYFQLVYGNENSFSEFRISRRSNQTIANSQGASSGSIKRINFSDPVNPRV
jgi:hypothetical protein